MEHVLLYEIYSDHLTLSPFSYYKYSYQLQQLNSLYLILE